MKYFSFIFLKPEALRMQLVDEIMSRFLLNNINIELIGYKIVDEELINKHYESKIVELGETFKIKAKNSFVGKAVISIILSSENENIIKEVRKIVGATDPSCSEKGTIRGDFSNDSIAKATIENRCCENLIHASDSREAFLREIKLWFSKESLKDIYELADQTVLPRF